MSLNKQEQSIEEIFTEALKWRDEQKINEGRKQAYNQVLRWIKEDLKELKQND